MLTPQRIKIEKQILEKYFPKRHAFQNLGNYNAILDIGVLSNSGKTYLLKILLNSFPNNVPPMYLVYPKPLRDYEGNDLEDLGASGNMHLLDPDEIGNIQLCHYISRNWSQNVTLYKVALKGLIWINAYEGHLRTGQPLDYFLAHEKI